MAETFIPLFSSTVRSSLWSLSGDCLKVFLTLALEAGPDGMVVASVDGIRRIVDMPLADVQRHLATLEAPDPYSKDRGRDTKNDGRRLERTPHGWRVVNLQWYRDEARRQAELFRKRKWWNEKGSAARRDARPTERETYPERETETETEKDLGEGSAEGNAPAAPPPAAGAAPKPKRTKPRSKLPADFAPIAADRSLATELRVNLDAEFPKFIDYHRAKGSLMADWRAALRTWLRNTGRFGGAARGLAGGRSRNSDVFEHIFRKATENE